MMEPSSFERRILVAVTGLSPQIVTETLYALATQAAPAFVPTEVHLITTAEGAERARLSLLSDSPGGFHALRRDYGLPEIAFPESNIHVLLDAGGKPLSDIRSPEDNRLAADLITTTLRDLTADPDSALHVSIAGGRKTMGFFMGYALTLFGRPQDRLSHVLVSEPFESCPRFYYPTPYSNNIEVANNRLADTKNAQVTLAEIPFVSLRHGMPDSLLDGQASYSEAVKAIQSSLGSPSLMMYLKECRIVAHGVEIVLPRTQMALLAVFARRLLAGDPPIGAPAKSVRDEEWGARYLDEIENCVLRDVDDRDATTDALKGGMDGEYFSTQLSRLRKILKRNLGPAAAPYLISDSNSRPGRYHLALDRSVVRMVDKG